MGIIVSKVRIENFRSIENLELTLSTNNVLIGANNSGKSNFLAAINIALGQNKNIYPEDIYVGKDEVLGKDKCATIDIKIIPIDDKNRPNKSFSDFWVSVFTNDWITSDSATGDYVGIRTVLQYDNLRNDYVVIRKQITDWGTSVSSARVSRKKSFNIDMYTYISAFYMDAQRDVVEDIRDRKSYFGRTTSRVDLSPDVVSTIEAQLNSVNTQIVDNIPTLKKVASSISSVASTVGVSNGTIEIEPLARKLSDLHKGMDIFYRENDSARLSVSQNGMGTRSWISFLTLNTYVDCEKDSLLKDDPETETYFMLTMEEPEAHLHPQAQQKLYSQLSGFNGQKIISTHSPSIVAQANLDELIHFEKEKGKTTAYRFDDSGYKQEEINRIRREVISSRGELLFSKAVVLCEGITEEQALPVYFREFYGIEPVFCGVNIVGIGGQHYKTFLSLFKNFNIRWFIFSDGEDKTVNTVKKAVRDVFGDKEDCGNVIILNKEEDYEKHLIKSGYGPVIDKAICDFEGDPDYVNNYIANHDQTVKKREKTNQPICQCCKQFIYKDIIRDYSVPEGRNNAIYDCCTTGNGKAKYAAVVAEEIIKCEDKDRRIPPKVKDLLIAMQQVIDS